MFTTTTDERGIHVYHWCENKIPSRKTHWTNSIHKTTKRKQYWILDIGANNYPIQSFLCFLMLKLHPSFLLTTINLKNILWATTFHITEKYVLQGKFWQNFIYQINKNSLHYFYFYFQWIHAPSKFYANTCSQPQF